MTSLHFILSSRARVSVLAGAFVALSSSFCYAQATDKPLDLTILSTNEDNVSFVVVEDKGRKTDAEAPVTKAGQNDDAAISALPDDELPDDELPDDELPADELPDNETSTALIEDDTQEPAPQVTGRMVRQSVKDVGLASIGIGDAGDDSLDDLDNRLWRGVPLARALRLIEGVPVPSASDALRKMSYHVIARQAVPPKGAAQNPAALLGARMDYLSRVGRSDGLAAIIAQLPQTPEWQEWHVWKLFYDLMSREDEKACAVAAENAETSLDALWQKTNILCQILTGDEARAAFSADVLKASGLIDDTLYFDLIDVLLRRASQDSIVTVDSGNEAIDFMHLILMDAAHVNITGRQLAALDNSYAEAANALRYLDDDARRQLGMGNLRAGLIAPDAATALFLSSRNAPDTPLIAMTRRLEAAPDQADSAAVGLYLAVTQAIAAADTLSQDEAGELVMLILSAISTEVKAGDGAIWVPRYAPHLRAAMGRTDMTSFTAGIQTDYAMVLSLASLPLSPLPTDGGAVVMADYGMMAGDETQAIEGRIAALERLQMTALYPLLDGALGASDDWFSAFANEADGAPQSERSQASYEALSQTGLFALEQAAVSGQRADAIIISAMVIADTPLHEVSPSDAAKVARALAQAGLPNTAAAFAQEVLMAHMMTALLGSAGDEF